MMLIFAAYAALAAVVDEPSAILKYINAIAIQKQILRASSTEVEISARVPKLRKESGLRSIRRISPVDEVSYEVVESSGDKVIQREVIMRYLTIDAEAVEEGDAVTPANYVFRFKTRAELLGRRAEIYRLTPKKKNRHMFKGELWLDEETGMPLRETGQFVKNASFVIKSIRFVREYTIRAGMTPQDRITSTPDRITSTIETRGAGRVELLIQFGETLAR